MGFIVLWLMFVMVVFGCLVWSIWGAVKSDAVKQQKDKEPEVKEPRLVSLEEIYRDIYNPKIRVDHLKGLL